MNTAAAPAVGRFWDHSAWAGVGLAASGACQWAAVAALARYTDAASVGAYALANAIATPLFVLSHFGQRTLMVNGADRGASLKSHVAFRLATGLGAAATALLAGAIIEWDSFLAAMVACVAGLKLADSILDACLGAFQREHRMDLAGSAQFWQALLSFSVFMLVLDRSRQALWAVAAWAVMRLAMAGWQSLVGHEFSNVTAPREALAWRDIIRPSGLGWPLGCAAALAILTANLPRLLLEGFAGRTALGHYAAMASLEMAGAVAIAGAAQVAAPRLAASVRSGDVPAFRALLTRLVVLASATGLAGVALAILGGNWLLVSVFGSEYANSGTGRAFPLLLTAAGLAQVNIALMAGLSARHLLRVQPYLHLAAIVMALALGCLLVPRYQLEGAAWTTLVAAASQLAGASAVLWFSQTPHHEAAR